MSDHRVSIAALAACALVAPAGAQQTPPIADFLATIGGDTSLKTVGADRNPTTPQVQPLARDASEIVGHRFFRENMGVKKPVAMSRAKLAFEQECLNKGGRVLAEGDPVVLGFRQRRLAGLIPKGEPFHVWEGYASVCANSSGRALGGLTVISEAKGYEPRTHDGGSALIGLLLPSYVRTAIYAYDPRTIASAESEQDRTARAEERYQREVKRDEEFRRTMAIGTETNCGTVIEVRGPMVEVAVLPLHATPNGQPTFWSKRTALYPPGRTLCSFGM